MTRTAPFVIGLTGSIGMGKSTTAAMFHDLGIPVWDADAAVHRLYSKGGAGVSAIAALWPDAIIDGAVSRGALKDWLTKDKTALQQIEAAIHPLVARDREHFLAQVDADIVVLDIPLLFETGASGSVDLTVVVSVPEQVQRSRVLARADMTDQQFNRILANQMPDSQKRRRADFVISTATMESARMGVESLLNTIRKELKNA